MSIQYDLGYSDGINDTVFGFSLHGATASTDYSGGYSAGQLAYENAPFVVAYSLDTNLTAYAKGFSKGLLNNTTDVYIGMYVQDFNNGWSDGLSIYNLQIQNQQVNTTTSNSNDTTTLQNQMYANGYADGLRNAQAKLYNFFVNPQNLYYSNYTDGYTAGLGVYEQLQNTNTVISDNRTIATNEQAMYQNGYSDGYANSSKKGSNFFVGATQQPYYSYYVNGYNDGQMAYTTNLKSKSSKKYLLVAGIIIFILFMSQ